MAMTALRVFIGSGEASVLERKVLEYSIRTNSDPDVEVVVYNGTHDTLEYQDGRIEPLRTPLDIKYRNVTEFSNFRWFIPQICGYRGRAVYLDSDMICFSDINTFNSMDFQGAAVLAKPDAYGVEGKWGYVAETESQWGLSMMVMDCDMVRWDPQELFLQIAKGNFSYKDLHYFKSPFLSVHPMQVSALPEGWNDFDEINPSTKLVHYTALDTQPWKFPNHPHGDCWFEWLDRARSAGVITDEDIAKAKMRAYVRQDILNGNRSLSEDRQALGVRAAWRDFYTTVLRSVRRRLR